MAITAEMPGRVEEFYLNRKGYLINIGDHEETCRISSLIDDYCLDCNHCEAGKPVISLGEIDNNYSGSGLFAVGLLDIDDKSKCPIVKGLEESNSVNKMLK